MIELLLVALGLELGFPQEVSRNLTVAEIDLEIQPLPVAKDWSEPLVLDQLGVSVLVQDLATGLPLWHKDDQTARPIASVSKLLTYAVIRENYSLDEVVRVDPRVTKTIGSKIGLYAYEELTIETLLRALIISSANDAAVALALYHRETEEEFAQDMQAQARKWGLNSFELVNSSGLDKWQAETKTETANKASARDVAKLARRLWQQDSWLREIAQKTEFVGTSVDERFFHEKKATNVLLGEESVWKGLKTGYTVLAGECLVGIATTEENRDIMIVVLGSSDRFSRQTELLDWVNKHWDWN